MIVAGLDMGVQNIKVVILKEGEVVSREVIPSGFEPKTAAEKAVEKALDKAGFSMSDIERVAVTGVGVELAPRVDNAISIISADAQAAVYLNPSARTVIDVGAEETRVIKCDERGAVLDFTINERCAAGAGAFLEAMARTLELSLKEMGALSLKAEGTVSISATCVIFAESDVVSLIHKGAPKHEIARAIYDALAERIASMAHRVGLKPHIMLVGGVANDIGFASALKRKLGTEIMIPNNPEFSGALGAALYALKIGGKQE